MVLCAILRLLACLSARSKGWGRSFPRGEAVSRPVGGEPASGRDDFSRFCEKLAARLETSPHSRGNAAWQRAGTPLSLGIKARGRAGALCSLGSDLRGRSDAPCFPGSKVRGRAHAPCSPGSKMHGRAGTPFSRGSKPFPPVRAPFSRSNPSIPRGDPVRRRPSW